MPGTRCRELNKMHLKSSAWGHQLQFTMHYQMIILICHNDLVMCHWVILQLRKWRPREFAREGQCSSSPSALTQIPRALLLPEPEDLNALLLHQLLVPSSVATMLPESPLLLINLTPKHVIIFNISSLDPITWK